MTIRDLINKLMEYPMDAIVEIEADMGYVYSDVGVISHNFCEDDAQDRVQICLQK